MKIKVAALLFVFGGLNLLYNIAFAEQGFYEAAQLKPSDGEVIYNYKTTFKWPYFMDSVGNAGSYMIRFSTTDKFKGKDIVCSLEVRATQFTPGEENDCRLEYGRNYFWQINVSGSKRWSWSPIVRFSLQFEIPQMIFPEKGATVNSQQPTFRFSIVEAAQSYEIQVSEDPSFTKLSETIADDNNSKVFFSSKFAIVRQPGPDAKLETDDDYKYIEVESDNVYEVHKAYYWRVRSVYLDPEQGSAKKNYKYVELGRSIWSEPTSFMIPTQPSGEQLQMMQQITRSEKYSEFHASINSANNKILYAKSSIPSRLIWNNTEIWLRDIDFNSSEVVSVGEVEQPVVGSVANSGNIFPIWFPDGLKIAFVSNGLSKDQWDVIVKSIESDAKKMITDSPNRNLSLDISPDGSTIVYDERNNDNEWYIWIIQKGGTSRTQLVMGYMPSFSPDGKRIAYAKLGDEGNSNIWIVNIDGTSNTRITNSKPYEICESPKWHPNGKLLVYSSTKSGNWDIWLVSSDGTKKQQLTTYLGYDIFPTWAYNGNYIIFSSTRNMKTYDLWLAKIPDDIIQQVSAEGEKEENKESNDTDLW